jgi:hypothetical protein
MEFDARIVVLLQAKHLVKLFKQKRKGFFIEAGAFDGESFSNTLYLEKRLGWTGLLAIHNDAIPTTF